jgi:hypothetical protein
VHTHVISSIIHIDHEYFDEDEAWPIEIEDHDGELHSLLLEPGQVRAYPVNLCVRVTVWVRVVGCGCVVEVRSLCLVYGGVIRLVLSTAAFFGLPLHCVVYC